MARYPHNTQLSLRVLCASRQLFFVRCVYQGPFFEFNPVPILLPHLNSPTPTPTHARAHARVVLQVAYYNGTLAGSKHQYVLDDHHVFETGVPMLVCGNTAAMVGESWLKSHFTVVGDMTTHCKDPHLHPFFFPLFPPTPLFPQFPCLCFLFFGSPPFVSARILAAPIGMHCQHLQPTRVAAVTPSPLIHVFARTCDFRPAHVQTDCSRAAQRRPLRPRRPHRPARTLVEAAANTNIECQVQSACLSFDCLTQ